MQCKDISFIIPIYNRPDEIKELLISFDNLSGSKDFEIVIIEDGSDLGCKNILGFFKNKLKNLFSGTAKNQRACLAL